MTTFDETLQVVSDTLRQHSSVMEKLGRVVVNRDLYGRIRLVVESKYLEYEDEEISSSLLQIAKEISNALGPHAYPAERVVLFESDLETVLAGSNQFLLHDDLNVVVVDRLATEGDWATIAPVSSSTPRVVFYSIKGGVGRSTALSVAAWSMAQAGRRVLVVDLDLESPGLAPMLLPEDRKPGFGVTDWLVEDLVDNGDSVFGNLVALSPLAHDGEIYVVPAHGANPGEYISKLGRAWMAKNTEDGKRETWSKRLERLVTKLENEWQPDVILLDSRSGIDELASACVTDLGAYMVLLFAVDGDQTWSGYEILLKHWHRMGVIREIRERLQVVAAMIPEIDGAEYRERLREHAWNLFTQEAYDEVPPRKVATEQSYWSFDESDEGAPHFPWEIRWHRGFASISSLHSDRVELDADLVRAVFGGVTEALTDLLRVDRTP